MKKLLQAALTLLILLMNLPSRADSSVNGQWQYVVLRGDSKGTLGNLRQPNCPLYVGYLSFDFNEIDRKDLGSVLSQPNTKLVSKISTDGAGKWYKIGTENYEQKGSYTSIDDDSQCANPATGSGNERAPLSIEKIAANGHKLYWTTDFTYGSEAGDALWKVEADYDGANSIKGKLKAYACSSSEGSERKCSLLNTANFQAKRIQSIKQALERPVFSNEVGKSPLTTFFEWFVPRKLHTVSFQNAPVSEDTDSFITSSYVKPNLSAVLPARAFSYLAGACAAAGGDNGNVNAGGCKACKNINCAAGQVPSSTKTCEIGGNCGPNKACKVVSGGARCAGPCTSISSAEASCGS